MMRRADKATAYLLWAVSLFGVCGLQRFYTGQVVWGILYLVTFGFFGIGQLIDLILIPGLVNQRNAELRRLYWVKHGTDFLEPPITGQYVWTGSAGGTALSQGTVVSPLQQLLKTAHEHGRSLSEAQIALHTGLTPEEIKQVLQEALRLGYADVANDPKTGAVRYVFDI
jgi:TM2 domain-containing membrane protein YozV